MIKETIYIDGGCSGNPGPMRIAMTHSEHKVVKEVGNGTNNRAEYLSLIYALIYIKHHAEQQTGKRFCPSKQATVEMDATCQFCPYNIECEITETITPTSYEIKSDSQLLVKQVQGLWKIKSHELKKLHARVWKLIHEIEHPIAIEYVPREENYAGWLLE